LEAPENKSLNYETSIAQIKDDLKKSNEELLYSLEERFLEDLVTNMVFYLFQSVSMMQSQMPQREQEPEMQKIENSAAKTFIETWKKKIKKSSKKELLEINNSLKSETLHFLNAISDFSIASTEEYQSIYDEALKTVQRIFEENIL
jgi:hypothetical protein